MARDTPCFEKSGGGLTLIVSSSLIAYFYWLDTDARLEAAQLVNDGIANMAGAFPERPMGMGTMPM